MNTNSKIVILGGGTAGWLTALFIQRNWPKTEISVIEDPNRPPIIAGESGNTTFVTLLRHLKIDNEDFIRKINATPKLGGKFTDWGALDTEFIHCLQTDYAPWLDGWTDYVEKNDGEELTVGTLLSIMTAERAKDTYLKTLIGNNTPLADAFFANYYIKENKVPFGATSEIPCTPMWHFESRGAAAYFKQTGLDRKINLIEGKFQEAVRNEKGDITAIKLDGDRTIEGDWFFDCSGFARLLMGKTMEEPIVDNTNYFPARSVVAWWDEPCPCVTTNATAMKYGWSWNINIRNRSGNGYIYDPDHISLDQAVEEASQRFNKKIEPIANFSFMPGMMRRAWRNNVFAIGLSSGFLEPLEANGIAVIVESLFGIQDYWNPATKDYPTTTVDRFNDRIWKITEDISDFLTLHYRGNRTDTEFWRSHKYDAFRIPDSLRSKLDSWKEFFYNNKPEPWATGYSSTAWLMVIQGLGIFNHAPQSEMQKKFLPIGKNVLNINKLKYQKLVEPFWTIEEWLKKTT